MISPIAQRSYAETQQRVAAGEPVKGTGRRINAAVQRPPIMTMLSTTGTIESLAEMRAAIEDGVRDGEINASEKTLLAWRDAIWVRVFELMALQPHNATYIYNVTLRWPKPDGLQLALEAQMKLVTAPLPPPCTWR